MADQGERLDGTRRPETSGTSGETGPQPFRLRRVRDLLTLLEEQIKAVRSDPDAGPLEKARTVGQLVGITLKAMEAADLAARVDALEAILKRRKVG